MTDITPTDRRLQLLALGYQPIPNKFKAPAMSGWNQPDYITRDLKKYGTPEDVVRSWERRYADATTTGVRLADGLGMADADLDDAKAAAIFWQVAAQAVPELVERSPARFGKSEHKVALVFRVIGEPFGRVASRRYGDLVLEIFGAETKAGKVVRQFGMYGPHSEGANYVFAEGAPALHDGATDTLPGMSRATASAFTDAFDAAMVAAGFEPEQHFEEGGGGTEAFDITPETRFEVNDGGLATYDDLDGLVGRRCAANFIPGEEGRNRSRCWIFWSGKHDCVGVYDHATAVSHYPASCVPNMEKLAGMLRELKARPAPAAAPAPIEPPAPDDTAELVDKVSWLLATRGYFEGEDKVVLLYDTRLDCRVAPGAFERRFRAWFTAPADKRRKPQFATDAWAMASVRVNLAGVRMRPDMPFPLFEEGGRLFKNTYRKPVHAASGGDVAAFVAFMEGFLPDPVEREWLLDWMAHKQARPEVPGTAVMFVADSAIGVREGEFGTGRGLLFRIAHALYGDDYARSQTFSILDGSSNQSQFTDWMHGTVLVTVDESRTSPTSHRRGERHAAYEILKDVVDPAPKRRSFTVKNGKAFDAMSYCSFWVATNHADAVAIPANDRRFTVLRNGSALTGEGIAAIVAWIEEGANIAALSRWLAARDLSAFDMFQPLHTEAKADMAELALSPVEEFLRDLADDPGRGLVFTREHLMRHADNNFRGQTLWQGEFHAAWSRYCVAVKTETGGNYRRVRTGGTQRKLFCFRVRQEEAIGLPEAALGREAAKWGDVDGMFGLGSRLGLTPKTE
jgi:hypothetical protein